MRSFFVTMVLTAALAAPALADPLRCDTAQYKAAAGLTANVEQDLLVVTWAGQGGTELRARYTIQNAQPVVRDLAVRRSGGQWATLGQNLTPEYYVVSGVRRMTTQQADPLRRELGREITPEVIEKNKWYAFWDAPLVVPGVRQEAQGQPRPAGEQGPVGRVFGLPRKPEEIRRTSASFNTTSCHVKTDGARIEVTFPGLSMGIFSGSLRFTAYRGTNLMRMDAVAKTDEPSVAYKYEAGLKGFSTDTTSRVVWRDTGGHPQEYRVGGVVHETRVPVRASNRVLVAEGKNGSVATFPMPHTFFFSREVDTNLGYVWYRKDDQTHFGIGVRQADAEEVEQYRDNFALYNAPPGTWQRMGVYFYASPDAAEPTREAALALTHGDQFKPVPGYKTFVNHFHLRFTERLRAQGTLDAQTQDVAAMKALGINIVGMSDFHGDMHPNDPGPLRFKDWKDYGEASAKASDRDFLVTPWEEPSAYFGGHYNTMFPKNVYWSKVRQPNQPFTEKDPTYGTVYHVGNAEEMQKLLDAENGYWYHSHPRTKGTTGYPDAMVDKFFAKSDRYLGIAFKPGMGADLSEQRLCAWRCFDALDMMNNLYANTGIRPKYLIADVDTYKKSPEDDLYPNFPITYVKLDRVPAPNEDWSPILRALRDGNFFVTTGEVLFKSYAVEGTGSKRTIVADIEWTFPLEFVEVVWGDGKKVDRQIISATDLAPFGTKKYSIPFDATGKSWVRFAIWDSAGNGAFVQPVWLNPVTTTSAGR